MLIKKKLISIVKKLVISLFIGSIVTGIYIGHTVAMQKKLSQNIIRIHVIANSDSANDQILKIKVRDKIFNKFGKELKKSENINLTKELIVQNLKNIESIAEYEIKNNGYNYTVKAEFGNFSSPQKNYNDKFLLPAGYYESLKVTIGDGLGQNWWGVIYPALCIGEDGEILHELSEDEIKSCINDESNQLVVTRKDGDIVVRFKLLEIIQKARSKIA